jgi:hypothetical protein
MAATARLIVLMPDEEKAALEAQAAAANVSTAELARRRLFGREDADELALRQLLAVLKPVTRKAGRILDGNLAQIRALRARIEVRDAEVTSRARGALSRDELDAVAERLHLLPEPAAGRRRGGRR